ncbi:MAG: EF-P 5-aminopentanol modification-associated protein YfmH [Bacilli bacterium]
MILKEYKRIEEKLYIGQLDNGLTVKISPQINAKKKYAYLCINFGAKNLEYYKNQEKIVLPHGTAHFLEHLMFQMKNKVDAMEIFSKQGANANAYTSYDSTVYYFNTVSNFEKNLNLLLDLVYTLDCLDIDVEEEKGIIEEELKMSLDNPIDNLINGVVNNLYQDAYVNYEIGGTIESINKITLEILKEAFTSFYTPKNMELIIVGNVDKEKVLEIIKNNQAKKSFSKSTITKIIEKYEYASKVNKENDNKNMEIIMPKVAVSFKLMPDFANSVDEFIFKKVYSIILSHYFSKISDNWQEMLDLELVSKEFDFNVYSYDDYRFVIFEASSYKPLEFVDYIYKKINEININEISEDEFLIYKKALVGSEIRSLGNVGSIANNLAENCFKETEYFENLEKLEKIDLEMIKKAIKSIDKNTFTNYVIYPK